MSKRRRKKRRGVPRSQQTRPQRRTKTDLHATFERADKLIERGQAQAAVELLEPLLESSPREPDLHYYLGYARAKAGDTWGGIPEYERAQELSRGSDYWLPLAALYMEVELRVHGLRAFRQAIKQDAIPINDKIRATIAALEESVAETASALNLPVKRVTDGIYHMEKGQLALHNNNFSSCIAINRRAIKLLRDWPPPHNNLSQALFFDGQPEKAIAAARRVLSHDPDNIQALANGIRFLAWTGQEAEAQTLWERLKEIVPQDPNNRLKIVEAAATLGKDESVYRLLKPLDKPRTEPELTKRLQFYLAVAEANTGRPRAQRRLRKLQNDIPQAGDFVAALKAGRPGPGCAERFPYFHSIELLPRQEMEKFVELVGRQDDLNARRFRRQVARFAARFPQIVLMAEKMIWEDDQADAGIAMLITVATPAAYAALRRFGLSQAGADETRMQALFNLAQAEEIGEDEAVRVWHEGEWREVQLRQYEISGESEIEYSPQAADLLEQGTRASQQGENEQAERLFQRVLELEPRAKEAYNNLGTIYANREEHAQAREAFQTALELDPLYVFPRCNLASYLLLEDDVAGAEAMLKPLAESTRFHPQEMAFYSFTQARVLAQQEEYEGARQALQMALKVWPDYELAENMLERLDSFARIQNGFAFFREQQFERDQAKRVKLQAKLSTPEPSLSEALPLYTKDSLTRMGRVVLPWGGWSALRKAELVQEIITGLVDPELVAADLNEDEQNALRRVLAGGGTMPWEDFDAAYGNDLEESPYWQWHEPETTMGRLRLRGLLVETTVAGELLVAIPVELRQRLRELLEPVD